MYIDCPIHMRHVLYKKTHAFWTLEKSLINYYLLSPQNSNISKNVVVCAG